MAETGWTAVDFVAAHHVAETDLEKSARLCRQAEQRQERADLQAEAERVEAAEDERERRRFAYAQLGIAGRSLGEIAEAAIRAADQEDRYQEALKTIDMIGRQRQVDAENRRHQAEMLEYVTRGRPVTDPLELATMRAQAAADDAARQRQAVLDRARAEQQSYRPLVSRSQPRVSRSQSRPRHVSFRSAFPFGGETREDLARLGPGQWSQGGCPPCSGCDYVICRCGQW